jgi:cytochrome c-type biogenesis protein CcmE
MSKKTARILLSVVIVGGAFSLLLARTVSEGASYYKKVDEVMVSPEQWYGKPMNLHGFVVPGSIQWKPSSLDYRFTVRNGGQHVAVTYRGLVPDTFKDEAEVVLKGRLGADGFHVEKDGVVAKCPSRYEPTTTVGAPTKGQGQ